MIRRFRMTDAPCQLLQGRLNSRDLVYTRASLGRGTKKLTRVAAACYSMSNGPSRKVLGSFENGWLEALVITQTRKAATVWEVSGCFSSAKGYSQLDELLLAAASAVGESGAERMFLRCAAKGPACGPAQRAGFHYAYSEELLVGRLRAAQGTPMHFRPVRDGDSHDVFRLQMATAPIAARPAIGLTLREWEASRELSPGRTREYVCDTERGLSAWARLDTTSDSITVEATLHPDLPGLAPMLVEGIARVVGRDSPARWIVPIYQPYLATALTGRGWQSDSTYEVSVKPVARQVHQPFMTPVQA